MKGKLKELASAILILTEIAFTILFFWIIIDSMVDYFKYDLQPSNMRILLSILTGFYTFKNER